MSGDDVIRKGTIPKQILATGLLLEPGNGQNIFRPSITERGYEYTMLVAALIAHARTTIWVRGVLQLIRTDHCCYRRGRRVDQFRQYRDSCIL